MSNKLATIFTLSLLLCFGIIYASRPNVEFDAMISSLHEWKQARTAQDVEAYKEAAKSELDDESCEGVDGREECLIRRTLAAHVDYIYTQKHKPRN